MGKLSASEWLQRGVFESGSVPVRPLVALGDGTLISIQQSHHHYCDDDSAEVLVHGQASVPRYISTAHSLRTGDGILSYVPLKDLDLWVGSRGGIVAMMGSEWGQ